ncbi:MAG TPA: Hsp70 family protein, partial [Caulobacteraceae bacterium]|nr:Hsp70 family protein [Caulobacteraceae bacterium]
MSSQPPAVLGIDFGTTNTVVAIADADGQARLVRFAMPLGGASSAFRSVLSFQEGDRAGHLDVEAGPWAVEAFLEAPRDTRLIQSFKSFAASATFSGTSIWGKRFQFSDLMWAFLRRMLARTEGGLDAAGARAVAGRPVVFAGAEPDETLAMSRYAEAYRRLGVADLAYAYEPVAAALFFARRLQGSATVLVADFGGGTSDFSLMRFTRQGGQVRAEPLSRSGV